MTNHELAALRQLYTEWRGGHVLHPEHPAHREIADLLARNLLALLDAAEERDCLRSQRDALLAALGRISRAKPDRLDHAEDVLRIERAVRVAKDAIAAAKEAP